MFKQFPANECSFAEWSRHFSSMNLDLGTGDGTFVIREARRDARIGIVGIDTCLDHLRGSRRQYPWNARFERSDARELPDDFSGKFGRLTVNFPYGSLLTAIVENDVALREEVQRLTHIGSKFQLVINESALAGLDLPFEEGARLVSRFGEGLVSFTCETGVLSAGELRAFPSSWSKKLGYGRHPRAVQLVAHRR